MTASQKDKLAAQHERRVLGYLLGGTAVLAVVLLSVFLVPVRRERRQVERRTREVERDLLTIWRSRGHVPLHVQNDMAREQNMDLKTEWQELRSRVDTFRGQSPLAQALSSDEEGRIDFKVALFDARVRLAEMAADRGTSLPADLGVPETIATDEDAEYRRWQLASVYRLLELLMEIGIPVVERVEAVPPVVYALPRKEDLEAQEYRVRLTIRCSFEHLLPILDRLSRGRSFFTIRRFLAERTDRADAGALRVKMTCGGIRFAPPKPQPRTGEVLEGPYLPPDHALRREEEESF